VSLTPEAVLAVIDETRALVTGIDLVVMMLVVTASVETGFALVVAKIEVGFWDDVVNELTEFRSVATVVAPLAVEVNAVDDVVEAAFDWTLKVILESMVDAAADELWTVL